MAPSRTSKVVSDSLISRLDARADDVLVMVLTDLEHAPDEPLPMGVGHRLARPLLLEALSSLANREVERVADEP